MEAAEEKKKIREEILAKGRTVTISEVFQVRVIFLGLNAPFGSSLVDICITRRRTGKPLLSKVKN